MNHSKIITTKHQNPNKRLHHHHDPRRIANNHHMQQQHAHTQHEKARTIHGATINKVQNNQNIRCQVQNKVNPSSASSTNGTQSPSSSSSYTLKKYRIENESFRLWSYYRPSSKKLLGRGGYGVVMEAIDTRTNEKVAIKKMKNVFAHLNTAKCSLRELTLLMHFAHPNIMNVTDCMMPESKNMTTYQAVYYVMPRMQSTLKTVCCYSDIDISVNHRCFILYQILTGCKYIHSCDVIHRDLKPENILINSDCSIRITDFGMARGQMSIDDDDDIQLSEYVTTRWYRAPEIMLCSRQYSESIDVWSMACIYCEMILRKPMFAGNNHLEQLEIIFDCVGTPNISDSKQWIKSYDALRWVLSLPMKKAKSFEHEIFNKKKDINRNECDLLSQMFILNPNKRISVQNCLQHKFFKKIPAKIKLEKEINEFKNIQRFDENKTFEAQLTKLSLCRSNMLNTLTKLHKKSIDEQRPC